MSKSQRSKSKVSKHPPLVKAIDLPADFSKLQ